MVCSAGYFYKNDWCENVVGNVIQIASKYIAQAVIIGGMISGFTSSGSVNSIFSLANSL